jgi:antitoxin (DNA-binding transcriptional repressor) of toxin-antitoxin stability system
MISKNTREIRAKLCYYVNLAIKKGETIVICSNGVPTAQIKAVKTVVKKDERKKNLRNIRCA